MFNKRVIYKMFIPNEKYYPFIVQNLGTLDEEIEIMQKEESPNITFQSTNEKNNSNSQMYKLLNNKRENNSFKELNKKHTKYSYDNLKRECKHLVIENIIKFINNKIYEVYEGKIGDAFKTKKLFKLNPSLKINSDVEFNKLFIKKTLKDILSQGISRKITFYESDHNKKVIEEIILEKKSEFENLFNLTFIQCVEHFIGDKQIQELNGLTLFKELKGDIIQKYGKEGETYYENLRIFLKGFENRINKAKSRKKRIKTYKQ